MKSKQLYRAVLLFGLLFVWGTLTAQITIIYQQPLTYQQTTYQALSIELPGNKEAIRDHWEEFLESRYDVRVSGNGLIFGKKTLHTQDASIPDISDRNMNLYARVENEEQESTLHVFASFGPKTAIDPQRFPLEYQRTRQLMEDFYVWHNNALYQQKIERVREDMSDLNASQSELQAEKSELQEALITNREQMQNLEAEHKALQLQMRDKEQALEQLSQRERAQELYLNTLKANLISRK